jgi:hypothetical protein
MAANLNAPYIAPLGEEIAILQQNIMLNLAAGGS